MPPHPPLAPSSTVDARMRSRGVLDEIGAFLLGATCAGCDAPGELLCARCRAELVPRPAEVVTPHGRSVTAALVFEGVVARCVRRLKGEGETLLARPLGAALAAVLLPGIPPIARPAGRPDEAVAVVPVPTSRSAYRRRGYRVPDLLIRRAGHRPHRLLAVEQVRRDQRGLGALARRANVQGTLRARHPLRGHAVVLVDDVVTTGATLDEAARALESAGARVISVVALAATPSHSGLTDDSEEAHRRHGGNDP